MFYFVIHRHSVRKSAQTMVPRRSCRDPVLTDLSWPAWTIRAVLFVFAGKHLLTRSCVHETSERRWFSHNRALSFVDQDVSNDGAQARGSDL